jgi:hypothetical protein
LWLATRWPDGSTAQAFLTRNTMASCVVAWRLCRKRSRICEHCFCSKVAEEEEKGVREAPNARQASPRSAAGCRLFPRPQQTLCSLAVSEPLENARLICPASDDTTDSLLDESRSTLCSLALPLTFHKSPPTSRFEPLASPHDVHVTRDPSPLELSSHAQ